MESVMNDDYITYVLSNSATVTAKKDDVIVFNPMLNDNIAQSTEKTYINIFHILMKRKATEMDIEHYKCHGE